MLINGGVFFYLDLDEESFCSFSGKGELFLKIGTGLNELILPLEEI